MKTRRSISSVVGMVFAIIALTTTLAYITYSMDTLEKFNQVIMVKSIENTDKVEEEFDIISAETTPARKFKITVQNTGNLPVNFTRLWVENTTHPTDWVARYNLNTQVYPGGSAQNIGDNLDLYSVDTQSYKMKLVTERGNSKEFFINSASQQPLYITLDATPDTIFDTFTTTLKMNVVNNMSNNNLLLNLEPKAMGISCTGTCTDTNELSGPEPTSYDSLKAGDTATFKWVYELDGVENDAWTFTGELNDGYTGNTASDVVTLKAPPSDPSNRFLLAFGRQDNIDQAIRYGQFFTNFYSDIESQTYSYLGFDFYILEMNIYLDVNPDQGQNMQIAFRDDGVDVPTSKVTIPGGQTGKFSTGPINRLITADSYINLEINNSLSNLQYLSILIECTKA